MKASAILALAACLAALASATAGTQVRLDWLSRHEIMGLGSHEVINHPYLGTEGQSNESMRVAFIPMPAHQQAAMISHCLRRGLRRLRCVIEGNKLAEIKAV